MYRYSISEVHRPREIGWESVGKVTNACCNRSKSTDKYTEDNSWEEKYPRRCFDMMKIFEKLSGYNPSKKSSGD